MNADINNQQLQRPHYILMSRCTILVNKKIAILQHDNAPTHTALLTKKILQEPENIKVLPHVPFYTLPRTCRMSKLSIPCKILNGNECKWMHHFRSLANLMSRWLLNDVNDVENKCLEFFGCKPLEWYQCAIKLFNNPLKYTSSKPLLFCHSLYNYTNTHTGQKIRPMQSV